MGSRAYGCNELDSSDYDIRGIFTPPKVMCFPNTQGLVVGFDQIPACEHWVDADVTDDAGRKFDFDLHNITKFMKLALENNPNQVDLLFAHETLVTHVTAVGRMILDSRRLFLSKLCWVRFRGYAASQMKKIRGKKAEGKRVALVEKYGYDVKFAYHCIRLLNECVQILTRDNLVLSEGSEEYKEIRRGDWSMEQLESRFASRMEAAEQAYLKSTLPDCPDAGRVKTLLLSCLEHHYGSLAKVVARPDALKRALLDIDTVLDGVRHSL